MNRREWIALVAAIVLASTILGGALESVWSLASVLGYVLGAIIAGIAAVLVWGFRARIESRSRRPSSTRFANLTNGPLTVSPGVTRAVLTFPVDSGDYISGSATETHSQKFSLTVRSSAAQRRAEAGQPSPTLFYVNGSASSIGIGPAPAPDTYYFTFEPTIDLNGRVIVIHLQKSYTADWPRHPPS